MPDRLTAGQQISTPRTEQRQVGSQTVPAGLDVRCGLLQRQWQPAQLISQFGGSLLVTITSSGHKEPGRGL